jgi:hypothetical protein
MAAEPRWNRTNLAQFLKEMLKTTDPSKCRVAIEGPVVNDGPYYVFLLMPPPSDESSYHRYREARRNYLFACCKVARLQCPEAKDIIGIATETGIRNKHRSEDALYLDLRNWNPAMELEAKELQERYNILRNPRKRVIEATEYPDVKSNVPRLHNSRNKPCPCGSGKKYKRCCLNK